MQCGLGALPMSGRREDGEPKPEPGASEQDVEALSAELKRQVAQAKARISERMSRTRPSELEPQGASPAAKKTPTPG